MPLWVRSSAAILDAAPFRVGALQLLLFLPVFAAQLPVTPVAGVHGEAVLGFCVIGPDVEDPLLGCALQRQAGGAASPEHGGVRS